MIPFWVCLILTIAILSASILAIFSSIGLCRFSDFVQRLHASALVTTLSTLLVAVCSMIYFSLVQERLIIHEVLVIVLMLITTPIVSNFLMRIAIYHKKNNNNC